MLISEQDAVHGFKGLMSTTNKPTMYSSGPMTGSMTQSGESKQTLITRNRPSVSSTDMLRTPVKSPGGKKPTMHHDDSDDEDFGDIEKGHGSKLSFAGSVGSHALPPLNPCWTVGNQDATAASCLPRTPQSGGTCLSIREIRERMQEQVTDFEQAGGRGRAPSM